MVTKVIRLAALLMALLLLAGCAEKIESTEKIEQNASLEQEYPISEETKRCLGCHEKYTPGIVADWRESRHARVTPAEALKKPPLERRVSGERASEYRNVVGCYECHSLNVEKHADAFQHFGFKLMVVVSPEDCRTCHSVEVEQYMRSTKAYAYDNLAKNPVYSQLVNATISMKRVEGAQVITGEVEENTREETCFGCHGTVIKVAGYKDVYRGGLRVTVPDLRGWPNQGVGRINPDGSRGACTSCHPRHGFSIEIARKPYTCAQCHLKPDVPAWNVYKESKHGNIFFSKGEGWDFEHVPWVLGKDIKAPTCAACHNALLVNEMGEVVANRTHDFGERIWIRLFGLIYAHPQPRHGATYKIKVYDPTLNAELPLPSSLSMEYASDYLISPQEMYIRKENMKRICKTCHSTDWVDKHFSKFEKTVNATNAMTYEATKLMLKAWEAGIADDSNLFDEYIEKLWVEQWLFYGNTVRYASAMTGAHDYQSFMLGWWDMSKNLKHMESIVENK